HAFQPGRANCFERQPGLRHKFCLEPAFGSDNHHFPFSSNPAFARFVPAPQPFARNGDSWKNVTTGAAARDQQIFLRVPAHDSSACWLMFNSTPVANSIPIKL